MTFSNVTQLQNQNNINIYSCVISASIPFYLVNTNTFSVKKVLLDLHWLPVLVHSKGINRSDSSPSYDYIYIVHFFVWQHVGHKLCLKHYFRLLCAWLQIKLYLPTNLCHRVIRADCHHQNGFSFGKWILSFSQFSAEFLYDWLSSLITCLFLEGIASTSTYPSRSVTECVGGSLIVSDWR